jgi:hypothetical protein
LKENKMQGLVQMGNTGPKKRGKRSVCNISRERFTKQKNWKKKIEEFKR